MQRVGVALRYSALGVINSLPEIVKFNFSRFGADFVTKTVKPGNAAVSLKNAAVESQNEAEENAFDIRRGVPILVTGRNLVYIPGDLVTVSRTVDGAEVVLATIAPEECDYYHQSFAWPAELDGVAEGSELKFTFRLRGGDETASPVAVSKTVRVSSAETPPAPVVPEPTLTYCHSEEHTEDSDRNVVYPKQYKSHNRHP